MTLNLFIKNLVECGYTKAEHPCLYSHYFTASQKAIVVDNVRGGAYRLFLGVDCVPASYPARAAIAERQIDAESPWSDYHGKAEKTEALDRCWQWLRTVGFLFLADPFSRELHKWITDEKILIRDRAVIIPIPRVMKLP